MVIELYPAHIGELQRCTEVALAATSFDGLVIHSGTPLQYFADDHEAPFRSTPHFARWLPHKGPEHLLVIRPGNQPLLINYSPDDFWYEQPPLGNPFWAEHFDIVRVEEKARTFNELPSQKGYAFLGDCPQTAEKHGFAEQACNPAELLARLDWDRSYKTAYEIGCIGEATKLGTTAHRAARDAFYCGASELEIHYAYMKAIDVTDESLPFPNIIALNEKGAILHYLGKRKEGEGSVLVIDCGASYLGYHSDITRTWTRHPPCDSLFEEAVRRFDQLQQGICAELRPGLRFHELHHLANLRIGDLLQEIGLISIPGVEAVERGITSAFFPHGLGHFLGVQVHDISGRQSKPSGGTTAPPELYPLLRTTRLVEKNQVFTIEPGLYFIEKL